MTDAYETGAIWTAALPSWQRTYYEEMLLDTIRMRSILYPFAIIKEDFAARNTGQIVYSEVYDLEPNWNTTSESTIWMKGGALDSRTISINLAMYHDIIKWGDYNKILTYFTPQFDAIVKDKLGQSLVDTLDILARNSFLSHPYPSYAGTATSRATLTSNDLFDPDFAEDVRAHLEDHDVPGIVGTEDGGGTILCITTPRVIHDIRTQAGSDWLDVQNYNQTGRKFTAEVGMWAGVRFIRTNRLRLRNAGLASQQTQLAVAIAPGEGAYATVDVVYSPGQSGATQYITVDDETGFEVGDYITVHTQSLGTTVLDSDGLQETRRIINIDAGNNRISVDKPFLKDHAIDSYVTKGLDVHASLFIGGPSVVMGVAERPHLIFPPKMDDAMMVNRLGWRGYFKYQLFRPEWFEVHYSAGSADAISGP